MGREVAYRKCGSDDFPFGRGLKSEALLGWPGVTIYLAELGGNVVGELAFGASRATGTLHVLGLESYHSHRGIGLHLVGIAEAAARETGADAVVADSNNNSFWRHMGYKILNPREEKSRAVKQFRPAVSARPPS